MNDADWTAAIPAFAVFLVVTVVLVATACVWAERRRCRKTTSLGFDGEGRLK